MAMLKSGPTERRRENSDHAELVLQYLGYLSHDRHIPAADEQRSNRFDPRLEAGVDAPFHATQVGLCSGDILLTRK